MLSLMSNLATIKPKWSLNSCVLRYINSSNNGLQERKCDVVVIGGGIIGTAIARKLKADHNNIQVFLLEKECTLAKHQSSHNSGVMHCGVYYKPGSLKAKFCVEGLNLLQKYCDEKNINYKKYGKLIVAKNCSEVPILKELLNRGIQNQVKDLELLESNCDIIKISSGCRGIKALWCPQTANVNFKEVVQHFAHDFISGGGKILLNTKVITILESHDCEYPICIISEDDEPIHTKYIIASGGLQSESLTKLLKDTPNTSNQTFLSLKVDYQRIESEYCDGVQTNIYPVPDLTLPFLGSHFSQQMNGSILLGPYAIPALKNEGYCNDEISIAYVSKILTSCGFRNMIIKNFSKCVHQVNKAICKEAQIKDLQELVPNFSYQFVKKGPTAVQCQLLNVDGAFANDFVFDFFDGRGISQRIMNVKFTPSPAATSCLSIANHVIEEFNQKLCQS